MQTARYHEISTAYFAQSRKYKKVSEVFLLKYIRAIGYFDSVKLHSYKVRAHTASSSLPFIKIIFS